MDCERHINTFTRCVHPYLAECVLFTCGSRQKKTIDIHDLSAVFRNCSGNIGALDLLSNYFPRTSPNIERL